MNTSNEKDYRPLTQEEIEIMEARGSTSGDWKSLRVKEGFDPTKVTHCRFYGQVRIGRLDDIALQTPTMALPVGLNESTLINSEIGDNAAIYRVSYLSGYIVGEGCLIKDVNELSLTDTPSFGEMAVDAGGEAPAEETESKESGPWEAQTAGSRKAASETASAIEVMNENGRRAIYPFEGMTTADAHLWAKERGRPRFIEALEEFTRNRIVAHKPSFGRIGSGSLVQGLSCGRDLIVGEGAVIEGSLNLIDCRIESGKETPTRIGAGVELRHGIVGRGCVVETGAKGEHFVLADCAHLSLGARLSHSYLGENSTISCCEVAHSLMLPFHGQHHNSSFLIAALLEGQANIASGATIGSNHSSRRADGEILCRRGFWPALTASIKHPSYFASYSLLAKEDYPHEIYNPLPFSLISREQVSGALVLLPAFWFIYNRYALERNRRKFRERDRRTAEADGGSPLPLVYDPVAQDTVEEVIKAQELLAEWTGEAWIAEWGTDKLPEELRETSKGGSREHHLRIGFYLLKSEPELCRTMEIRREGIEKSKKPSLILKVPEAYSAYRGALLLFAVKTLADRTLQKSTEENQGIDPPLPIFTEFVEDWVNIGGSLFREEDKRKLIEDVETGRIGSWEEIHLRYRELLTNYHKDIMNHAYTILLRIGALSPEEIEENSIPWNRLAKEAEKEQEKLLVSAKKSREKDFTDPFRLSTFSDKEELTAVLGSFTEDPLIKELEEETAEWKHRFRMLG